MSSLVTLSDCASEEYHQARRPFNRDNNDPYEWNEEEDDDEAEEPTSSSYANSSHHGSPQMVEYHHQSEYHPRSNGGVGSPSSRHSSGFQSATSSAYNFEDEKVMGSLEDRFPFLKEERKRTRKLLTAEQTRVLEAILEKTVYPSTPLREAVARQLGIPPRKVQIWFQNKRQGRRRAPSAEATTTARQANQQHRKQRSSEHLRSHRIDIPSSILKEHPRRVTVGEYNSSRPVQQPFSAPLQDSSPMHRRMHSGSYSSSYAQHSFPMERSPRVYGNRSLPPTANLYGSKMLPPPQQVSRPGWQSSNSVRSRPAPLTFENKSARSSNDSLASSASSYRGDDWTQRVASLSSSSTRSTFSDGPLTGRSDTTLDASLSKHMLSLHQITAAYFASTKGEKLQLPPIDSTSPSSSSKQTEALPGISELIRD